MVRGGSIINIAGSTPIDDPEYRYKMPAVFGKIEGSGNGIKTVIPNISAVASSLHRHPGEVNKFFGCELGAQTKYSESADRAVVNGAHTDATLQKLIHRYIDSFVLCPNCGLPETDYKIKSDSIFHKCAACGAKEMINMSHKLCNFILKESKDKKGDKKKNKKVKDENDSGKKKTKDKKKDKKDKKDKKKKDGKDDYIKDALMGGKKDGEVLSDDSTASLVSEIVDDESAMVLAVEGTKNFIQENPNASVRDLVDMVTNQQMASALKSQDKVHIFVRAAITPQFFKNKEIQKYAPAISGLVNGNKIMERHLIAALEFVNVDKPKNFPVMIKQLYDEDALDEEAILEWAEEGRSEFTLDDVDEETRALLRAEAEPVIVWLQEADSDDESGAED